MAKNAVYIVTLALISIILISAPNLAQAAPATHIELDGCEINGPDGVVARDGKAVITMSSNGNINMVCHGQTTNTSGKAFVTSGKKSGDMCGLWVDDEIGNVSTYDWELTVSDSGEATLSCHFKN